MARLKDVDGNVLVLDSNDTVIFQLDADAIETAISVSGLTLTDATDVTIKATTGSKIGQSGSKIGFFGVTPAVRPTAGTEIKAALASLGLLTDGSSSALHLDGGTLTAGAVTIADGGAVTISATTGTKIGQSTSKIGFFGTTAAARPSAYTLTYSTTTKTNSNLTAVAPATTAASTAAAAAGYATKTQANAIALGVKQNGVDITNIKGVLTSVITDLKAIGLLQ